MNPLFIEKGEFTPKISFDPESRQLEIVGISRPENVGEFYEPVLDWFLELEKEVEYGVFSIDEDKPLVLKMHLAYFNSATSKVLWQMLEVFNSLINKGLKIKVEFYYDEGDEQMLEDGQELSETSNIPFEFIEVTG